MDDQHDNANPDLGRASVIDAALAIAHAAQVNAQALTEAACAVRQAMEHVRNQVERHPIQAAMVH